MSGLVAFVVFLPVVVVWALAVHDVLTRKDISARRRLVVAVLLLVVFPLTVLYLLARPPSTVRRGPETADDPRTALVDRLDSSHSVIGTADGGTEELAAWVAASVGVSSGGAER